MKTFKEFMSEEPTNIRGRRALGLGRQNKVSDFNHLRYGADQFNPGPAKETQKRAPKFYPPSSTMRRPRRFETPNPKRPSHLM